MQPTKRGHAALCLPYARCLSRTIIFMTSLDSIANALFSLKGKSYAVAVLHSACSPGDDWRPPTTQSAFRDVEVVVHARVKSQIFKETSVEGQIEVIQVFKGAFSGEMVLTADSGACGIGKFNVGEEYVFFFRKKERYFVSHLVQPWHVPTQQILHELRTRQK